LRVIAVGDDDQNIYEWRGSDSAYFESLLKEPDAQKYELIDNYRSNANIVEFANQFAKGITHRFKTTPIRPVKNENGIISICTLSSENIVIPAVRMLQKIKPSGSTCIIARTNEEVLTIAGLLHTNGILARKIQTNEGFNVYDLAELRAFIEDVCRGDSYAITDDAWRDAIHNLNEKYADSNDLPGALKLIVDFDTIAGKTKYKSDFRQFVRESRLEDCIAASADALLVSTIHQAKGREFDNVFLALSRFPDWSDPQKRAVYVAITRAKQNLHIVCNGGYFDTIYGKNIERTNDTNNYPAPGQISLQLSHKDVWLDFFASVKKEIDSLMSGRELSICETGCCVGNTQVLRFSKKFCAQIQELGEKGYFPARAVIRHIVFWQGEEKEEIKIILPDLEFSKK
jgi:ATP-dependent DNA helicase RecQ